VLMENPLAQRIIEFAEAREDWCVSKNSKERDAIFDVLVDIDEDALKAVLTERMDALIVICAMMHFGDTLNLIVQIDRHYPNVFYDTLSEPVAVGGGEANEALLLLVERLQLYERVKFLHAIFDAERRSAVIRILTKLNQ